jgi:hypothetical protein
LRAHWLPCITLQIPVLLEGNNRSDFWVREEMDGLTTLVRKFAKVDLKILINTKIKKEKGKTHACE